MSQRTRTRWVRSLRGSLEPLHEYHAVITLESVALLLGVWWLLAVGFGLTDSISSPVLVAEFSYELLVSLDWVPHIRATLRRTLYGFMVTLVVGTGLGILMGISDFWEKALQDYIIIGLSLPSLFAAVFAAMWFGISDVTPMVAGSVIAFPFLTQNVYESINDIDAELLEMARSFSVSRRRVLRRVVVQSILPAWFGGARYAFSICWKITTLAELFAAEVGYGFMIEYQMRTLSLTGVLSWGFLFLPIFVGIEYGVFRQIEKRVFDWRQEVEVAW